MKKALVTIIVVILFVSLVTGCAPKVPVDSESPSQPIGSSETSDAPSLEGTKIVIAGSQNWIKDIDRELADKFTEETGVIVDIQAMPDDQYVNILKSKLASGEGPDIFYVRCGAAMADYLPDKYLADLSNEAWVSRMTDWARNSVTWDTKVVGINLWSRDGWGILYNKSIFEQYNLQVPRTFDEFMAVCKTLLDNGIQPIFHNSADAWHDAYWLDAVTAMIALEDPAVYGKLNSGEAKFSDFPEMVLALDQINQLVEAGYFGDDYMSQTWDKGYEMMGTGQVAMINAYTSYSNEIAVQYPESGAEEWGMFPVPLAGTNVFAMSAGGLFRGINVDTKNMEACLKYFEFLARPENIAASYAGHPELGETSFVDVEGNTTNAYKTVTSLEMSSGGTGLDFFDGGVKYCDLVTISKIMQEMYLGAKDATQVLASIDEYRAQMLETENVN